MSQNDSLGLYKFYNCSIGNLIKNYTTQLMHIIYFYADKQYPVVNSTCGWKGKVYKC